mgnify:CR=1 FL=1
MTYKGKSGADAGIISVLSKGDGGLEELKNQLKDDLVGYCLLRQTDQIDESATVKFVFVHWVGENTPRMQKAKVSIHLPTLKEFLGVSIVVFIFLSQQWGLKFIRAKIFFFLQLKNLFFNYDKL